MRLIFILITLFVFGCSPAKENKPSESNSRELLPEPDKAERLKYERNKKFMDMPMDSSWNLLAFKKGGCLTGGQYIKKAYPYFGNEGCVMSKSIEWELFTQKDKEELTDFLFTKLASSDTTKIHTCPFFNATEGELAVYTLQKIYLKNWYDLEGFTAYKTRETTFASDSPQSWLQAILSDDEQREKLIKNWRK